MAETAQDEKYVITGEAMLSYPHLFEPEAMNEGEEPVYSACLVFEQGADLRAIRKAIAAAATEVWGSKAKSMFESGVLRNPIRRDGEAKGYPEGSVFINVRTRRKPGIGSARLHRRARIETTGGDTCWQQMRCRAAMPSGSTACSRSWERR